MSPRFPSFGELLKKPFDTALVQDDQCKVLHVLSPTLEEWLPCKVPIHVFVNPTLLSKLIDEVRRSREIGACGFIPALIQLVNVATLPGIVGASLGLPDVHSGYGFAIGNVAAFDISNKNSIVSPGGVGFDINCGVRLIRTNLSLEEFLPFKEKLAHRLFELLPVGIGSSPQSLKITMKDLDQILLKGMNWAVEHGYAWPEDLVTCEENGCIQPADPRCVSQRAKGRGVTQLGSLGAGNHYAEVQYISEIYNDYNARRMGIVRKGQICIMIHCGSRGLGHEVASNYIQIMEEASKTDPIPIPDPQLACAYISSRAGQEYIKAMNAAANFAYCNRSILTFFIRKTFEEIFSTKTARELDMHLIYDVSHNMAKFEEHSFFNPEDGSVKTGTVLVHRKGATRSFPPMHPSLPKTYSDIGQPVLVGGSMGTFSYILTGGPNAMRYTFGSTCHGAGRAQSRVQCKKTLASDQVLSKLKEDGIILCTKDPSSIAEEAPSAYKDVIDVVETCEEAGLSLKCAQLRPIAVIKG